MTQRHEQVPTPRHEEYFVFLSAKMVWRRDGGIVPYEVLSVVGA